MSSCEMSGQTWAAACRSPFISRFSGCRKIVLGRRRRNTRERYCRIQQVDMSTPAGGCVKMDGG
jgi:hypothetical protein